MIIRNIEPDLNNRVSDHIRAHNVSNQGVYIKNGGLYYTLAWQESMIFWNIEPDLINRDSDNIRAHNVSNQGV